ncbi:beta strand repeat-containing protein [Desulfonatronum thioautotrophicum]|uniref:beta strand repeat-containing protein n=1 Tax=Desulfonatronum thioautotrophicum TaxID=617001 RepID=UPI0005EB4BAD|nr:choice-of-anchor D domain-containing protein [Desulfonatronum thioautotrophicum]
MVKKRSGRLTGLMVAAAVLLWSGPGWAQDATWEGGTGNWNDATQWDTGVVPGAANDVFVDGGKTGIDSVVNVTSTSAAGNLTIDAGDTVDINDGRTLDIFGATVLNHGTLGISSTGDILNTRLFIRGDTTLSGSGDVVMSNQVDNLITGSAGSTLINHEEHTISGAGNIGNNNIGFDNRGVIEAVGDAGLIIRPRTGVDTTRINTGTMRATADSTLTFNTSGVLFNTGGTIEAAAGGEVVLFGSNTRIQGGTLTGAGDVFMRNSAVIADLYNDANITIENGQTGFMAGTITNVGTIALESTGGFTSLRILGDTTLTGTGLLSGSNNINNRIFGTSSTTLTQGADHTIRGAFNIGNTGNMALVNAGVIEAQGSAGITMRLSSEEPNSNSGEMRALSGSEFRISSTVINNNNGLIEAQDNALVEMIGARIEDGTLNTAGTGVIQLRNSATIDGVTNLGQVEVLSGQTGRIAGDITNDGEIAIKAGTSGTTLLVQGDTTLGGTGTLVMSEEIAGRRASLYAAGTDPVLLTNLDGHTIRGEGQIGNVGGQQMGLRNEGLIEADGNFALIINPNNALNPSVNTGTLRASGIGGMVLAGTLSQFDNQGLVEAVDGSSVNITGITLNNQAGTLTGGQWRAAGNGSIIDIRGGQVVTNNAEIILSGAGSQFRAFEGTGFVALEDSLTTNQGTLRILDNRDYTTSNDLTNSGLLQLGGGTLDANSLTNTAGGTLTGYGTVTPRPVNSGLIEATGGTLAMTGGIQGGSGTVTIQSDGALDLSSATQASSADFLNHQGTAPDSLNLGGNDFIVSKDYINANTGTGNAFDARANVVGTGQIIGENADMAITGDVTPAGANTVTLDLGNVRGETSTTVNYQIENTGTGADIRGAVQTAAGTGNITDARLSGTGVDAQNFGPIAAGQDSGDLSVTFTASSGGSLDGQTIGVVSNFDNVAGQTIQITGMATSLAQGSATPTGPIELGNFRVGQDGPSQSFDVTNLTTGAGAERLGIGTADTTGNFAATNNLGAGLIDGGASQTNALSAAVDNGLAGVNTGNLNIQYTTDGTHIDTGFTAQNVNSQSISLSATGYNMAQGSTTPDPVTIANQRVGGTESQNLTVSNTAPSGAFTEGLNAAFGANTGDAVNNAGTIGLLAGGNSDGTSMNVGVDTTAAGARTGSVTLNYETDGAGTSGFAAESVGSQTINVSGNVYQTATPTFAQTDINLGNARVGDTVGSALGVTNTDNAPAGFQESLNAGISATTGDATASGTIAQLTQGSSDTTSLVVGLDTTTAGARSGTATVDLVSTGVGTSGLADLSLGSQAITVSGNVFQVAEGNLNTTSLNFGVVQVGQSVSQNLSISNIATGPSGFVEDLNAQFGATSGTGSNLISGSGMISGLLAGGTDTTSMVVNVNTLSAGTVNGVIAVDYFSAGAVDGVSNGLGILAVGSQDFGVVGSIETTATVVDMAAPVINTGQPILLGNVREGAVSPTAVVSVTNQATGNDQAGLNAAITGNAPITASGSFDMLLPGQTDSTSLEVGMNTSTAGAIDGTATIAFVSDAGNHGGNQLNLDSQDVQVQGAVYRLAQGDTNPDPVAFGNLRINTTAEQALTVSNTAANDGFSEVLNAAFGTATGDAGDNAGAVNQLAAGNSDASSMVASLDTSEAGVRGGTVTVEYASDGAGTTGEAAISVGSQSIGVTGTVYRLASPEVDTTQPVVLAARVGDAAPTQNLSVTNQSPDAFTEGLKADIGSVDAGFAGTGSIDNLAAGGTDTTSLTVGLADTSTSQDIVGNVTLDFQSTGAGTTEAADIAVGSEAVQVQGRVYQQAEAQVNTTSVDFGIVHVGDVVGAQTVSVTNAAPSAALNDTLAGGFVNLPAGPFDGSGSVSGLGAGQTDAANLAINLDTSNAGIFDFSDQYLQFASQNPDMADLDLGTLGLDLFAQVNNFANPVFDILSGPGLLTRTGDLFEFSLGTVLDTSGPFSIELGLFNDTFGPSDLLSGTFDFSGASSFGITGDQTFSDLDAGDFTSFMINFNPMSLGLGFYSEMITLSATGSNASGFEQLFSLDLRLSANVAPIPEPGTMALLAMGLALLGLAARRGYLRR